jgi:hypothetical protein
MSNLAFKSDPEGAFRCYREQGFFCEPEVFTEAECSALIQAGLALPTAQDGSYIPTMNVHKIDEIFLQAMSKPGLLGVMDRLIGGRANGLHSQFYFTPPHRSGLDCHQDNYFAEAKPDAFASAWIALVDTGIENGGLYVYPGSHKEGKLAVKSSHALNADKREAVYEETIVPDGYLRVNVAAARGSVVFIHGYLAHGSNRNESNANRYALLNTYIRAHEQYRRGDTAQREELELIRR